MRNDGYYVTVDNNGEKSLCDVTYLKTIAKIKKAFNIQYENTYAALHIVKVENGIETIVYVKQFDATRNTNWVTTNRTTEKGWNDLASYEPAEVESQPAEVESQPAEVESQPAEVESQQPSDEPKEYNKLIGRYVAIQKKMITIDKDIINRYYLFDVSLESNKINIMRFIDNFVGDSIAVAYIVDKYQKNVIIRSKKIYTPDKRTLWIRKNDELSNSFLDDFRK